MRLTDQLEREFGGSWDGPNERMHGLISTDQGKLKVDIVRRGERCLCSAFLDGACLASARDSDPVAAVRQLLEAIEAEPTQAT